MTLTTEQREKALEEKRRYQREYYKQNRKAIREYQRNWRKANPDKVARSNEKYWFQKAQKRAE